MAEHPARLTAAPTAPGRSLPPQAPRPFQPSEPAPPSGPARLSVAANRMAAVSRPWPALSRQSRARRLLLTGAAATGIWLLCGLSHSASAHADAVSPHSAVPSVSAVGNQPTGLPAGQPATMPALPIAGLAHRAHSSTAQPAATGRLTLRLSLPPGLPARKLPVVALPAPVVALPMPGLPVPGVALPVPAVALPVPALPAPSALPPILGLPVPPVGLPLPPVGLLPLTPAATGHPLPAEPAAGVHSLGSDGLATDWGRANPHAFVRPSVARRHSIQPPAGPATPAPLPRPVPGSPDGPGLTGSGTSARDGRYLPLVVLPARQAAGRAIRSADQRTGDGTGPRDRACSPDVSPD
jgi:hypothetical protein